MNFKIILNVIFYNFIVLLIGIFLLECIFGKWFSNYNYGSLIIPRYSISIIKNPPYEAGVHYIY